MPFERYRTFVAKLSPTRLAGTWGQRLHGTLSGLVWDILAEGLSAAIKAPWLTTPGQPLDALDPISDERRLPKYILESVAEWKARLLDAWNIWEAGGALVLIRQQYEAAKYPGVQIHDPFDWNRDPDWISQFWVYLPYSSHSTGPRHRCGVGELCGAPTSVAGYGSPFGPGKLAGLPDAIAGSHLCGVSGPIDRVVELRDIANRFRAGHVVCREIIIELDASICGSGVLAGSHRCGGRSATIGTGATV